MNFHEWIEMVAVYLKLLWDLCCGSRYGLSSPTHQYGRYLLFYEAPREPLHSAFTVLGTVCL